MQDRQLKPSLRCLHERSALAATTRAVISTIPQLVNTAGVCQIFRDRSMRTESFFLLAEAEEYAKRTRSGHKRSRDSQHKCDHRGQGVGVGCTHEKRKNRSSIFQKSFIESCELPLPWACAPVKGYLLTVEIVESVGFLHTVRKLSSNSVRQTPP